MFSRRKCLQMYGDVVRKFRVLTLVEKGLLQELKEISFGREIIDMLNMKSIYGWKV